MGAGCASVDPVPAQYQELLLRAVGLQVEAGNDPIPDQNWTNEIAKDSLVFGNISFEAIFVIEEEMKSLALDDQRVEGGEDMNLFRRRIRNGIKRIRTDPVQSCARSFQLHGYQLLSTDAGLHQSLYREFALRVEITDRFHAHDPLRSQGTIQQVVQRFSFGRGAG